MSTTLQTTINDAFVRFGREVVTRTYAKEGQGTYDYPAQDYVIRVVIGDLKFLSDVSVKVFFRGDLEVITGKLSFVPPYSAKVEPVGVPTYLSAFAGILHGMLDRGEFAFNGLALDNREPTEKMFDVEFKNTLEKFNRVIVSPARQDNPPGKYQWPVGEYTLEVDFPVSSVKDFIPFTIFRDGSGSLGGGEFNTFDRSVTNLVFPRPNHVVAFLDALSRMVDDGEPMSKAWELARAVEPPMILTNMADINDEWVEWFRKDNPGTSYAKAVHAALAQIDLEMKSYKKILDKYAINRY